MKTIKIALCLILGAFGLVLPARANTWTDPETGITWTYRLFGDHVTLGGGNPGSSALPTTATGDLVIPSMIDGHPVTSIGECAFYNCTKLTSVTIPSTVTGICDRAFYNCSDVESLTIPTNVTSFAEFAFSFSEKLTSATLPGWGCELHDSFNSVTNLTISEGTTSIADHAFSESFSLQSVTIPSSVTNIGGSAFYNCRKLKSAPIPSTVKRIGSRAFQLCRSLTSVTIPEGVTSIGGSAFYQCTSVTSVTLSASAKDIGSSAFCRCSATRRFEVAPGNPSYCSKNDMFLSKDGTTLFYGVNGDVTIPEGVTNLYTEAFYGCTGLTSVTIPKSVTTIGYYAFEDCSALTSVTLPEGVKRIGIYAFSGCSRLASITLPSSLTYLDSGMFSGCSALTSFSFPEHITYISDYVFYFCEALTSITIPEGITSISSYAFGYCSALETVSLPASTTSISTEVFTGCSALKQFTVDPGNTAYCAKDGMLLTKDGTMLVSGINGDAVIPEGVTKVRQSAFRAYTNLTSVTIPESVTNIGNYAFQRCSKLTSAEFPANVRSIGESTFSRCQALTNLTFRGNAPMAGTGCFTSVAEACTATVSPGTSGWDDDGDGLWNNLVLVYEEANELLPVLTNPTEAEISNVFVRAQAADPGLAQNITNATFYADFIDWVNTVKTNGAPAGAEAVMASRHAWLSYALGSETLLAAAPQDGDLTINALEPTGERGRYVFTVGIKDIEVGSGASIENLKKVFGLAGGATPSDLSSENITLTFDTPAEGKVRFTAGPTDTTQPTFFMRVKLTP